MKTENIVYWGLVALSSATFIGTGYLCWILMKRVGIL